MPRQYTHKVDANQPEIVKRLRRITGMSVGLTHRVGKGFPDFVVGFQGQTELIELKFSDKDKLTFKEQEFHDAWTGSPIRICWTFEQIIELFGIE